MTRTLSIALGMLCIALFATTDFARATTPKPDMATALVEINTRLSGDGAACDEATGTTGMRFPI